MRRHADWLSPKEEIGNAVDEPVPHPLDFTWSGLLSPERCLFFGGRVESIPRYSSAHFIAF
jgi:hypothetical protein